MLPRKVMRMSNELTCEICGKVIAGDGVQWGGGGGPAIVVQNVNSYGADAYGLLRTIRRERRRYS